MQEIPDSDQLPQQTPTFLTLKSCINRDTSRPRPPPPPPPPKSQNKSWEKTPRNPKNPKTV
eukprot:CAMPEP_0206425140 /NCGR_PEP_ID=MMETSP0324_2-20121206/3628_1 /ASSEMBLY_ACC=CAM_ASM_000836 /TAXON_ID=2866 /ORGANISM="Crypthecodinium cohnii, Strain Seligo" /LENGTH=60 /DNA_ID=CAMNT_0053889893 /DNA_START=307 /DNA_END=489 /DNA_ORIENTATION=-